MGITSPNENLMTAKVRNPTATPSNPRQWFDDARRDSRTSWNGYLPLPLLSSFLPSSYGGEVRFKGSKIPLLICWGRVCRIRFLRGRNRPVRDFFNFLEAPQQRGSLSSWSTRPNLQSRGSGLTSIPPDRQRIGRTRATDIDSEGRRLGGPDPDYTDGGVAEKDVLPAYEVKGSPPNYSRFWAVDLGTATNARPQASETVATGTFPQSSLVETSSGTTNQSTQQSPGLDVQLPHPPPLSHSPIVANARSTIPFANP
jgi:hypothetical protein